MPTLIKNGQVAENTWQIIDKETALADVLAQKATQVLVPLALWKVSKSELATSGKEVGVWLDSDDDPYELADDAAKFKMIAVNFPVFRDGRAFSTAAILRERLSYSGELRAIGDIQRDQLFYMKKCGFDSFAVNDSVKVEDALTAFNDFSNSYQSTVENPQPLFRRR